MIWTITDYCKNCGHSVHWHIAPYSRDGDMYGYFKVLKWDMCDIYGGYFGEKMCTCNKFVPKDNLKYLEMLDEQAYK